MNEKITQWIQEHEEEMIDDLAKLVAFNSTRAEATDYPFGDKIQEVLEATIALGESFGFETENLGNFVGKIYFNKGATGKEVGIWAHLDVVSAGDPSLWIGDPFELLVKDGYLIGRGVNDNKGAAIATLYMFRCLKDLNIQIDYPLVLYVGTDEESGMKDTDYFNENYTAPYLSLVPDATFPTCFGEKASNNIELTANVPISDMFSSIEAGLAKNIIPPSAICTLADGTVIQGEGISQHSAFPEGGKNAIHTLMNKLLALDGISETDKQTFSFIEKITGEFYGDTLGIAVEDSISGKLTCIGTLLSMKDQILTLSVNIRCPIMVNETKVYQIANSTAMRENFSAVHVDKSSPHFFAGDPVFLDLLTDIYNKETGRDEKPFTMAGGTYAHKLPNALGFGMGSKLDVKPDFIAEDHGGVHQANELLAIESLYEAIRIYVKTASILNEYL